MSKFRMWFNRTMYGRNGVDALYRFQLILCIALVFVNLFFNHIVLSVIGTVLLVWAIFRSFSRNLSKRQEENAKYLKIRTHVIQFFRRQKNRIKYRKTKVYKKCPNCKSILCLPRKKGTHSVKCPSCSHRFDIRI